MSNNSSYNGAPRAVSEEREEGSSLYFLLRLQVVGGMKLMPIVPLAGGRPGVLVG